MCMSKASKYGSQADLKREIKSAMPVIYRYRVCSIRMLTRSHTHDLRSIFVQYWKKREKNEEMSSFAIECSLTNFFFSNAFHRFV